MSKMGRLNLELQEQLAELGYENIEQAEAEGYRVNYEDEVLERLDTMPLNEQDKAHEAWLEEKEEVLGELISVYNDIDVPRDNKKYIRHAIEFIRKGEM